MTVDPTVKRLASRWLRLLSRPELLAAGVYAADAIVRRYQPGLAGAGALDESAHLATTLLLVGPNAARANDAFLAGTLIGSCLIDVDHVPLVLLDLPMESAEDRPVSHSLPTLLGAGLIASRSRGTCRSLLLGITAGTLSHFYRDLATGGIPAWWPASRTLQRMPYGLYAATLALAVVRARLFHRRIAEAGAETAQTTSDRYQPVSAPPTHIHSTERDQTRRTGRLPLRGVAAFRR